MTVKDLVIGELKAKIMQAQTPDDFENVLSDMQKAYFVHYEDLDICSAINNLWPLYDKCEEAIYK